MFLAPEGPDVYRHNHQTKRLSSGGAKCYISSLWDRAKPSSKKLEVRALSLRDPEIMADVKGVSLSINLDRTFLNILQVSVPLRLSGKISFRQHCPRAFEDLVRRDRRHAAVIDGAIAQHARCAIRWLAQNLSEWRKRSRSKWIRGAEDHQRRPTKG